MTLKVATLNIWNKSGPWVDRLALIREQLAALQPDVLGLQEVMRLGGEHADSAATHQAYEIAEGLGYEVAFGKASDYGSGLEFGNALLSRFPIISHSCEELPGRESGETRSLLSVRLRSQFGELPVFVTHLNWKLHHGSVRSRQVAAIAESIRARCPIDDPELYPPILMGDFNAEPDSDEMRFMRGLAAIDGKTVYFADAWLYGAEGPGFTFDRKNRFAALAHEPPRRIDYILVRGPDRRLRGEPLATRLCFASSRPGADAELWPSDHFGVCSELSV